jgi:hypothetical protein
LNFILAAIIAATTLVPQPVIQQKFSEGETLDYELKWLKVTGGTARMTIAPAPGDSEHFRITSVARSSARVSRFFKVHDEIETTVAKADFSTVRYVKRLDEDGDKHEEVTVIADGIATRTRKKVKKIPVPRPVMDPISVIYHLRTLDLAPGRIHDLELISDGKRYSVHAQVMRREKVQTPNGIYDCVRVEPKMVSGGVERQERLFVWYTDDERRLPVRIRTELKVGAITATLRRVTPGVTSATPPLLVEPKTR